MAYQSVDKSALRGRSTPAIRSLLDPRPAPTQAPSSYQEPPIQKATAHAVHDGDDLDHAWSQRLAGASQLSHNFANIAVQAPGEQLPAPVQPELALQPHTARVQPQRSQPGPALGAGGGTGVVQARFVLEQPHVQQEPVAGAVTQVLRPPGEALQRYPSIDDDGREEAVIYIIYKNNGKTDGSNILYVGQTTKGRGFQRFYEHTTNDAWAPWYIHATQAGLVYGDDRDQWPFDYQIVETLKDVTKFETTVAEQWWLEHYLKGGTKLLNDSTPCTIENFNKRSGKANLYNPKNIGVDWSYKPSLKAK